MDQINPQESETPAATRTAAFSVHVFTAFGAGIGLLALLEGVREHWAAMFTWLGVALVVDALDGPIARRLDVVRLLPNWSGDVLDLVVDFVTYVFYFADRRMKSADNHFRGFPGLWNLAAFYLFLLHPSPLLSSLGIAVLIASTFIPFHVVHPVRVVRLRWLTLSLLAIWAVLAVYTLANDFDVGAAVKIGLCAIAAYVVASDAAIRLLRSFKA
jgi:phosphatidylcholine synthase